MAVRYLWILPLLFMVAAAWAQDPRPRIQEIAPSAPIADDPVVNPSAAKPLPPLPQAALAWGRTGEAFAEEEERQGWETAQWTHSTLREPGATEKTISITTPSVVLIQANWKGESEITISLLRGANVLVSTKSNRIFDGRKFGTAAVKVTSAGDLLIKENGAGPKPDNVDLYVGVLPTPP
jgi:hypothetical protein